jgi:hypothetical protein
MDSHQLKVKNSFYKLPQQEATCKELAGLEMAPLIADEMAAVLYLGRPLRPLHAGARRGTQLVPSWDCGQTLAH